MLDEGSPEPLPGLAAAADTVPRRGWRRELKDRIVTQGIKWFCGTDTEIPATAAADVDILRSAPRFVWLKLLGSVGVRTVVARSAFGHPFICHIGDVAEFPYYHRKALGPELALCAAWLGDQRDATVYDVGANVGYFSTQLAQIVDCRDVHAFEPVPATHARLRRSVEMLGLEGRIHPVASAVLDMEGPVSIAYSERNSLFSQLATGEQPNARIGDGRADVAGTTLDAYSATTGTRPSLVKIDVEGSEAAVLRGARGLLSGEAPPALLVEVSPWMLAECGAGLEDVERQLAGYSLTYVDDIVGQRLPFGSPLAGLAGLGWTCNLFAVPRGAERRSAAAFAEARKTLASRQ